MDLLSPSSAIILFCMDMAVICTIVLFYEQRFLTTFPDRLRKRWKFATRFLLFIPGIVLLLIGILILWVWKTEPGIRFIHALLVLSIWMPITFMVFSILFAPRKKLPVLILPAIVIILGFIPVIRLTPIDGFQSLFDQVGFMLPLGIGIATMAAMYIGLIHLNKKLFATDRFSIDPVHLEKTKF